MGTCVSRAEIGWSPWNSDMRVRLLRASPNAVPLRWHHFQLEILNGCLWGLDTDHLDFGIWTLWVPGLERLTSQSQFKLPSLQDTAESPANM